MARKKTATTPHYYSGHLTRKLARLSESPAVIVEAPSGYGKTTAIRDYLESSVPPEVDVLWFTAVEEAPSAAYQRLCNRIAAIDERVGTALLALGYPSIFSLGEICELVSTITCDHEVWLILDDFQHMAVELPSTMVSALLSHDAADLHVVIITQMLSRELHAALARKSLLRITSTDLRLDIEDISCYFTRAGVDLTHQEAELVFSYTDGWIIAVYLQLVAYRETGRFSDTAILSMMEDLIWYRLSTEQQMLLLRLSPFESITRYQLCTLLSSGSLPAYALEALTIPFIHYEPKVQRYEIHSILSNLLTQKCVERGKAFEHARLLDAGDLYRDEGNTREALSFYARASDYDRMLSLDLTHVLFEMIGSFPFSKLALDIAEHCPTRLRSRYPLSMLQVAWVLQTSGAREAFDAFMDELDEELPQSGQLRAEWYLLSAYQCLPFLEDMLKRVQQSAQLFEGACSKVILPQAPWCAGDHCQLAEFHIKEGNAENEAALLTSFISLYSTLTQGHGSGADALFNAELAYYRGNMTEAEILAQKALVLAQKKQQSVIQLGATRILAEIAVPKADMKGWQQAIDAMEQAASEAMHNTHTISYVLDTLHGILLTELQEQGRIADWLKQGDFTDQSLSGPMSTNGLTVHLLYLAIEGDYARLIGTIEAVPPEIGAKTVFSELLIGIFLALGYALLDERARALTCLQKAAEKGLPDGMILPFVTASTSLQGLAEELFTTYYPQLLDRYETVKSQYQLGWDALHSSLAEGSLPVSLTEREREIAQLAAEGLHNNEIAEIVRVSENTVRAHLRTIFQKLDVDRRARLAEKMR